MKLKLSSFTILIIFCCFTIVGLSLIPLLSVQLKPSGQVSKLSIRFSWRDASAKVIEQEATSKLEGVFNTVKGIRNISSTSSKGEGIVSLDFKKNSDMDAVRFEISNLIRQTYADLPDGVSYPQISGNGKQDDREERKSILSYSIHAPQSPYYIKKYAEDKLKPQLSEINGVNEISIRGATNYEWVITYQTNKLLQLNISVNDLVNGIRTYLKTQQIGIGIFKINEIKQEMALSLVFNANTDIEWTKIPLKKTGTRIIYVNDVASICFKEAEVNSFHRINGLNSVSMEVYADAGMNTIKLSKRVKSVVTQLQEEIKREGYSLKLTRDDSEYLIEEITKIEVRTLYSLSILLLLIIIINRSFKYLVVLLLSIIVNLAVSIIFYYILRVELHMYSFAGITISFGIIIDNSIIMIDHLRNKGNKKVFLAILAATLTTIGALVIILFLKEKQQLNLYDFGMVIAINIGMSLLVSLFFVPALLEKLNIQKKTINFSRKRKRHVVKYTKIYYKTICFFKRKPMKLIFVLLFIFGFGLPLHLTPKEIKGEGFLIEIYNNTLGNKLFLEDIKPILSKYIGGSLRLFSEEIFANSYNVEPEKTVLNVTAKMPPGCSVNQLNEAVGKMENIIAQYDEVKLYEANVYSARSAKISIYFKEAFEFGVFPFILKDLLESKAVSLGAADWSINGVGRGFSNDLGSSYKSQSVILEGYNYDKLYQYTTQFKQQLIDNSSGRIKEIEIKSGRWSSASLQEFYLDFEAEKIVEAEVSASGIYNFLKNQTYSSNIASIVHKEEIQSVKLISDHYNKFNIWDLKNSPLWVRNQQVKLNGLATIEKRNTGNMIRKENQKYRLEIAYDFIGTYQLANSVRKKNIELFKEKLPMGFDFGKKSNYNRDIDGANQYYALLIVILIIFFICAILLESLKQPFAIISMIPISFIGVFLTFYLFEFNFDQGGYASFILLCGISVNSALYIINEFNNVKIQYPNRGFYRLYFKAFNYKITPVVSTTVSTIVGLIPFVWNGQKEAFWFSFAVGSIGGLLFSLIGIIIYLPLFIIKK